MIVPGEGVDLAGRYVLDQVIRAQPVTQREAVIAAFLSGGCSLSPIELLGVVTGVTFEAETAQMLAQGQITLSGGAMHLIAELCAPSRKQPEPLPPSGKP